MINVLIGGDVCPIGDNLQYFKNGEPENIFNDLLPFFQQSDLSIVNLECPLIEESSPIAKVGPTMGVPCECINGLKKAGIDVVNLANNHILDHGSQGLISTLKACDRNGIATVGAGKNAEFARRILIRDVRDIRIGVLGIAEHEFSIATKNSYGANPLDLIDYVRNIKSNRDNFDYLIVLFHGGNEHYPFPSPRIKDTCQFLIEMGDSAVIVQHTHCPGCYEEYKNSFIVYGQGNLIFDHPSHYKSFHEGFLVKLFISENLDSKINLIPFSQSFSHPGARRLDKRRSIELLEEIKKRSVAISDDAFVKDQWLKFCEGKKFAYLNRIYGLNFFFVKLIYWNLFKRLFLNNISLSRLQNTFSCESHREVIETLLENNMT